MKKAKFTLSFLIIFCATVFAQESPLALFPSINPQGTEVAFQYQGDIWTVPANGGRAVRLTIHQAIDAAPQWSPDGKNILFASNRFGNNDIFVIPKTGGTPKRLTYRSSGDIPTDWTNDNQILFSTARDFKQIEWDHEIHAVSVKGGTPTRLLDALGTQAVESPDGKFIAFVRGSCRTAREEYRRSANKDIWLFNKAKKSFTQLTNDKGNDYNPAWKDASTLLFISSRLGKYNIHSLKIDDKGKTINKAEALTNFSEDGIRNFSVSKNANIVAFERKDKIYTMDITTKNIQVLNIEISADYRFDPIEYKTYTSGANELETSPNGKLIAFVIRGEVFITEADKEKSKTVNVSNHPYKDSDITWLNDSTLIFTSDRNGNNDFYIVKSSDKKKTDIFRSLKHQTINITNSKEDESNPLISPDGKKISYLVGSGKFIVGEIDKDGKISNKKVLLDSWNSPNSVCWSPDSKWLAYSIGDLNFNDEVFIQASDGSKEPVNVSMHPRGDFSPAWSRDGSKLGFISIRNNSNADVWYVWLRKADYEKTKQDWEDEEDNKHGKKSEKKKGKRKNEVEPIKIDFENIHERLVQVTSMPGSESNVEFSKDGKTIFFTAQGTTSKGTDLYKVKWDGSKITPITKGGQRPAGLFLDPQGKYIYMIKSGGRIARFAESGTKVSSIPFKAKMKLNYLEENKEIFEDACRTLRDGFYDPEFHGKDWKALVAKYKPWILKASTKDDFRYMFNIMLGQLNTSHMGMHRSGREKMQREHTGLIGIEFDLLDKGIKVKSIIPNSPADKEFSKLNIGDIILAVNGNKVTSDINFYSLFTNTPNEQTLLLVENKNGEEREVVIRPTYNLGSQLYEQWVKEKRAFVDKYSNGKLGYLHIKGMNWPSFERFERELAAAGNGKEGIVIDVRYNGGGWTTDYLLAVLNVKQHAYTIPRGATPSLKNHKEFRQYYAYGSRLPFSTWTKPSITLCNASSYSNAEIFSHAYKSLKIGKLVGIPTFGAVVSTGGRGLMDGSYVRLPFRAWYVKATDENMELGAAVPDIIIENSPDCRVKGVDEQLKKAVDELLKEVK